MKFLFLITVLLSLIAGDCTPLSEEEKQARLENAFDLSGEWTIKGGARSFKIENEEGKNDIVATLTRRGNLSDKEKNLIKGSIITEAELATQSQTLVFGSNSEKSSLPGDDSGTVGNFPKAVFVSFGFYEADRGENISKDFGKTSEILNPLCAQAIEKPENPLKTTDYEGRKVINKVYRVHYCLTAKTRANTNPLVMDISVKVYYSEEIEYTNSENERAFASVKDSEAELNYTATLE